MNIITGYRGEPHITSDQDRAKNQGAFGTGMYILDVGNQLASQVISANEVRIRDGVLCMQGCVANIPEGAYDTCEISNGTQGMQRRDLIVARYTKNSETNIEDISLVVIEGTPASSSPSDPSYNSGDIQQGDSPVDFPLYRVNINGITISGTTLLASKVRTQAETDALIGNTSISGIGNSTVTGAISTLNSNLTASLDPHTSVDGSGFSKNFKLVNVNDQFSAYHNRWYFSITSTTKSSFSNIPPVLDALTGTVLGYREVYFRNYQHIEVVVHELFPVVGREHYCFYNSGSWTGWSCYNNNSGLLLNDTNSATANMPANSQTDFTISISKTGYTPVGIVSISKAGGNSGNAVVGGFGFDSSNAVISMRNISSSALSSITVTVKVLYIINA